MPLTFRKPLEQIPPSLLQVGILQSGQWVYDALDANRMSMLAWSDDAQQIFQLANVATPNAALLGGPDSESPYHMYDPMSSGTLRFRIETAIDEVPRPFVIKGSYNGFPVVSYVSGLISEYDPKSGKDNIGITYYNNKPVYTWV